MRLREIVQGTWTLYAPCRARNECPFDSFLKHLEREQPATYRGLIALLEHVADSPTGSRNLPDSLSHQISREHGIWQFTKGSVRVLWFYDAGHCVICAHAFFKTSRHTPKLEIERAVKLKEKYMRCKEDGDIKIELIGEG